jgi:hypothetical protein
MPLSEHADHLIGPGDGLLRQHAEHAGEGWALVSASVHNQ